MPARRQRSLTRVIFPDSHGQHIDLSARNAFLRDLSILDPDEGVGLGDHLDCAGIFSSHQRSYTNEMAESYHDDAKAANRFLDCIQNRAKRMRLWMLEGNHEQHVERWASRTFFHKRDADALLDAYGPEKVMGLKQRGIKYIRRGEFYDNLAIPGCIRLGRCFFVHGISHSKHAASTHLQRFGANVVFGHIHRSQSVIERTVTSQGHGAWCPGTLAKLQPLYKHTEPTSWSHGYAVQWIAPSGQFIHFNVPIINGESMLQAIWRKV